METTDNSLINLLLQMGDYNDLKKKRVWLKKRWFENLVVSSGYIILGTVLQKYVLSSTSGQF